MQKNQHDKIEKKPLLQEEKKQLKDKLNQEQQNQKLQLKVNPDLFLKKLPQKKHHPKNKHLQKKYPEVNLKKLVKKFAKKFVRKFVNQKFQKVKVQKNNQKNDN